MLADLDLLLTAVSAPPTISCPKKARNARRSLIDAEVATLCVAQAVMGISSDREFLAIATNDSEGYFRSCPANRASTSAAGA